MKDEAMKAVWMRLRDEIRRQRGLNNFRGTEVHLLPRRELRIPVEARGSVLRRSEVVIHLTDVESDLWAMHRPEGRRLQMKDFDYQLPDFVAAILEICRGEEYLHTNSKTAPYRKKKETGEND